MNRHRLQVDIALPVSESLPDFDHRVDERVPSEKDQDAVDSHEDEVKEPLPLSWL